MDQFPSDSDIDGERVGNEEKRSQSQDMFASSLDVNGKTSSNSSLNSSVTNCSVNEESISNGDLLANNLSRYCDCRDDELPSPRKLSTVNTPEKIVLCVDICEDPDTTPFKLTSGSMFKPLYMVKRVIQIFMHNKQLLNKSHEFALMLLQADGALWLRGWTRDTRELAAVLDDLEDVRATPGDFFNLGTVLSEAQKHFVLPVPEPAFLTSPPYTVRLILFFCRSRCVPELPPTTSLLDSDFFTVDVVYVHEDDCDQHRCQEIYARLSELDQRGYSYIFDVARNATNLHNSTAKLLAHPLQRPLQRRARYDLPEPQLE